VVVRVKVSATDLANTVDEYRDALLTEKERIKERDRMELLGRKLQKWLLDPVRAQLKDATTIILVPFGPLYYVPFDALVVSDAGKPVRYALEDYRFAVQTTWTLESLMAPARPRSTGRMLAIANPDGTLPGAQAEVSRIMKTAVPDAQVLGRKDGTVKKVTELAGTSRYLHIATHGILDADSRKSYLKLSDGQLTVREIATLKGLRTNNDLVVLSACDTATELRDSAGDEVVSLASSFALAGSPTVVASLWEISDDSTAELMATFYRALEKDKGDRLEALRAAKLNLLRLEKAKDRPYASPWHWASFQLYGDFRAPGAR
jgi:CHAT domain-containing protein